MDLIFSTFEVLAVAISVGVLSMVIQDGESKWKDSIFEYSP